MDSLEKKEKKKEEKGFRAESQVMGTQLPKLWKERGAALSSGGNGS